MLILQKPRYVYDNKQLEAEWDAIIICFFFVLLFLPELPVPSLVQTHLVLWREVGKWRQSCSQALGKHYRKNFPHPHHVLV